MGQAYAVGAVGTVEDGKSPYGLYDMAGNAWERVSDWYDKIYYKKSPSQNPRGPEHGDYKVLRGRLVAQQAGIPPFRETKLHLTGAPPEPQ